MNSRSINKGSPVPIYYQLKELIKERIESGFYEPHERLPSERQLEKQHGISRMTARQALSELESEGYIYREQGKGSFVAEPKFRQALLELTSFSEDMQRRNLEPGSKVLNIDVVEGDRKMAQKMDAAGNESFIRLKRLRLADEEPLGIETAHLREVFCPGLEEFDFQDRSLYSTLQKEYDLKFGQAKQSVEATIASEFEARVLGIEEGTPMLATERFTLLDDGETIIEFTRSTYRGDRYKLFVELHREI
ncbi:MAG: GntR family transcriptional regulator [Candidatus Acetothermia bacterium]